MKTPLPPCNEFRICLLVVACLSSLATLTDLARADAPVAAEPVFGSKRVSIADFGGVGDGLVLNTGAFERAIGSLSKQGGGTLTVPAGIWLTGPIQMKSNINLHLDSGALIQFSGDYELYPLMILDTKGEKRVITTSPIYGTDLENVAITGQGIIDGAGDAWRPVKKGKLTEGQWKSLVRSGGVLNENGDMWWPSQKAMDGDKLVSKLVAQKSLDLSAYESAHEYLRPVLLKLVNCRKILLEGVTFQNSPNWHLNPTLCRDVTLRNITVRSLWTAQNSDAVDIESCRDVVIRDSMFDVGDDAICLKSGIDEVGRRIGVPTENVLVENCIVFHAHGGFTVGSEMSGGVRNVRVNNCVFMGTDIGLRFKSTRGRGGVVENIRISNIRMVNIPGEAISFSMFYGGKAPLEDTNDGNVERSIPVADETTPQFKDIHMDNIIVQKAKIAMRVRGLAEMPLRNLTLKNASLSADEGIECLNVEGIRLENVAVFNKSGPTVTLADSQDVLIKGLRFEPKVEAVVALKGPGNSSITIEGTNLSKAATGVIELDGAQSSAVTIK